MDLISYIIAIGILVMLLSFLGMPLSTILKASKLPAWAKYNYRTPWGNTWVDSNHWFKIILIKIVQGIIILSLLFFNIFYSAFKSMFKTLESVAKKK